MKVCCCVLYINYSMVAAKVIKAISVIVWLLQDGVIAILDQWRYRDMHTDSFILILIHAFQVSFI